MNNQAGNNPAGQITIDYSSSPVASACRELERLSREAHGGRMARQLAGAQVTVTYFMAAMPVMGMAAMRTVATLADKGNGMYEGNGEVQMGGTWQVTVLATKNGQTLAQKQIVVMAGAR